MVSDAPNFQIQLPFRRLHPSLWMVLESDLCGMVGDATGIILQVAHETSQQSLAVVDRLSLTAGDICS